jgi:hypothetical protein
MTEETKAGLKLLAEYMVERPHVQNLSENWGKCVRAYGLPDNYPYNTSWDALVPVYAKAVGELDSLGIIAPSYVAIWSAVDTDNKQAAFEAVVELVKLINKEKE